jgi:curved DNA-binding protein CbpA
MEGAMKMSLYDVLEVSVVAEQETIRAAYEALNRSWNAKAQSGDSDAQNRLKFVQTAYDVLSNPRKKALYDKRLTASIPLPKEGIAMSDAGKRGAPTAFTQGSETNPLIACSDCKREISREAVACPGCGKPMKGSDSSTVARSEQPPIIVRTTKSRGTYIILGLLLGGLGIHNFYAGYYSRGATQIILTTAFFYELAITGTHLFGFIVFIWVMIELLKVKHDSEGRGLS